MCNTSHRLLVTSRSLFHTQFCAIFQDARVGLHACEGLMLCASLPETSAAQGIIHHSTFCEELIAQLVSLYSKLPKEMDPADIDSVEAKWGWVYFPYPYVRKNHGWNS